MGEIIIAIAIKEGKFKYKHKNINASDTEISQSIAALELIKNKQVKVFEKMTLRKEE